MKKTPNGHREYSLDEIWEVISRYRSSELALAEFAQEEGIPPGRLHYWVYGKGRGLPGRGRKLRVCKPVFQEVNLARALGGAPGWAAEVTVPGGVTVRFSPAATAEWIGSVVQGLRRPC